MQTITLNMHTVKKGICLCNKKYVNKTRHAYKPEELNTLSWVSCPLCELAKTCAQLDAKQEHDTSTGARRPRRYRT